jgi:hypothetical protein
VPFFVRRVTFARWQGHLPATDEDRAAGRRDFVLGEADTDGLSLFEVDEEADRRLVLAAVACGRRNLSTVDLLEITDPEIRAFGTAVATPGGYPVARANRLHRSLPWEQAMLNALADHLQDLGRRAVCHARTQVKAAVAELAIDEVDAGPHREWLTSLTAAR